MIVGAILTGALHEDGFADSCDGFDGGWDKSHLSIMKDPRIGSYAALGLMLYPPSIGQSCQSQAIG